jgi:hypothetical protein
MLSELGISCQRSRRIAFALNPACQFIVFGGKRGGQNQQLSGYYLYRIMTHSV